MQTSINPYQPAQPFDVWDITGKRLTFEGVIEAEDYRRMLSCDGEWKTWLLLAIVLVVGPVPLFTIAAIGWAWHGDLRTATALFGGDVLILIGLWLIKRRIAARGRARRLLKRFPDLLGVAVGQFAASGMTFFDGVHHYWFGARLLHTAHVSKLGIRVNLSGGRNRFLAITARLFHCFSAEVAHQMRRAWGMQAAMTHASADKATGRFSLWDQIAEPPPDAILFQGQLQIRQTMPRWQSTPRVLSEVVGVAFLLAVQLLVRNSLFRWLVWALLVYSILVHTLNWRFWRNYLLGTVQMNWYQSGWITSREFALRTDDTGIRMPLDRLVLSEMRGDLIKLTTQAGGAYFVPRDSVADEAQWDQLCAIAKSRATPA